MTKEELQNIIEENRFFSLTCRTGDEIGDLVQEIYHDGMIAGYELAISRLQMLNRMPFKKQRGLHGNSGRQDQADPECDLRSEGEQLGGLLRQAKATVRRGRT